MNTKAKANRIYLTIILNYHLNKLMRIIHVVAVVLLSINNKYKWWQPLLGNLYNELVVSKRLSTVHILSSQYFSYINNSQQLLVYQKIQHWISTVTICIYNDQDNICPVWEYWIYCKPKLHSSTGQCSLKDPFLYWSQTVWFLNFKK